MKQNSAEKLCAYVIEQYGARLTPQQLRGPWTYIGSAGGEISGVVIDADGDHTGFRVMLQDLQLPDMRDIPPELELP